MAFDYDTKFEGAALAIIVKGVQYSCFCNHLVAGKGFKA
jgi:hypothetical protein